MSLSTWLTDDQLRELFDRYFAGVHPQDEWAGQLQTLVEQVQQEILNLETLDLLPDEALVERLLSIYRAIARIVCVPMYYKAITAYPGRVRAVLRYLLESDDDLWTKVDALMTSGGAFTLSLSNPTQGSCVPGWNPEGKKGWPGLPICYQR